MKTSTQTNTVQHYDSLPMAKSGGNGATYWMFFCFVCLFVCLFFTDRECRRQDSHEMHTHTNTYRHQNHTTSGNNPKSQPLDTHTQTQPLEKSTTQSSLVLFTTTKKHLLSREKYTFSRHNTHAHTQSHSFTHSHTCPSSATVINDTCHHT